MSNLVLPTKPEESFLEANLKLFFARYPQERSRLEAVLRVVPKQTYPLAEIEIPAAPSQPPIRVLLLLGIINPVFVAKLLNDEFVRAENYRLFIFEQDPDLLAFWFQNADLTQIINYRKTEWLLCQSAEALKPTLFRLLKPEETTAMMLNVQTLQIDAPQTAEALAFYEKVPAIYNETAKHVMHNHGNLDDSLLGIEVTLRNKQSLLDCPGIEDLKDHYAGCSALIVGAGPSLDQNLEAIKAYNDRFVVIAADAALKPLLNAGIRVDFTTSIERLNVYQKPFFENLAPTTAELVAFPVVHPEVLAIYPGNVRLVYRNYSFFAYFEKAMPKGLLRCGGSTSHLALGLASYFGCTKVFLVGLDSAYEEKDGLYRSHCRGSGHPDWEKFVPISEFNRNRRHSPPIPGVDNLGNQVVTNIQYYQWIKEYAEELAYLGHKITIKNCSATGLKIDGIPYVPLEDAVKNLDPLVIEKPAFPRPALTRAWDHKDLVKNFEGWKEAAEACVAESEALLQMSEPDVDRYTVLMHAYFTRFALDTLFVAFVIQSCAFRFFELENKWWAYDLHADRDVHNKITVLKERLQLFVDVLDRLIQMFKNQSEEEQSRGGDPIKIHQQTNS
jgi:hypothetical protein